MFYFLKDSTGLVFPSGCAGLQPLHPGVQLVQAALDWEERGGQSLKKPFRSGSLTCQETFCVSCGGMKNLLVKIPLNLAGVNSVCQKGVGDLKESLIPWIVRSRNTPNTYPARTRVKTNCMRTEIL